MGGHRQLTFGNIAELRAELDRISVAQKAGSLTAGGHWTPGQIMGHLAKWISFGYEGMPREVPWFVRLVGYWLKRRILYGPVRAGVKIPGVEGGTFGTQEVPFDKGRSTLLEELERLEHQMPPTPHPIFGRLTHTEWIRMHLKHAELHLGFLHY